MRTTRALTTVLFAGITIMILVLAGCAGNEKVLTPTKKPVTTSVSSQDTPTDTSSDDDAAADDAPSDVTIKEAPAISDDDRRAVPGPYQTLYCNLLNLELDDLLDTARSDLDDADNEIADIQADLTGATGEEKTNLQADLRDAQASKTAVNKDIEASNKRLTDVTTKCQKFDKKEDAALCTSFTKDITARITAQQATLASAKKQLGFMAGDPAKATRQQRVILAEQRTLDRLNTVKDDLTGRCS